jgi:hypothetical protein
MEQAPDTSWLKTEPLVQPLRRRRWTVQSIDTQGRQDPFTQPTFLSRRRAERYARRHTCQHRTVTVVPFAPCRCGHTDEPTRGPSTPSGCSSSFMAEHDDPALMDTQG